MHETFQYWLLIAQTCALGPFAKHGTDLAHSVPQSRRGLQNNSVHHIRLAIPVSRLDRSEYHFHAYTYTFHDAHTTPTHTLGQSRWELVLAKKIAGPLPLPNSACTLPYHAPARPRTARPDSPGRSPLRGSIPSPPVPEGGQSDPRIGSRHIPPTQPQCPTPALRVCSSFT